MKERTQNNQALVLGLGVMAVLIGLVALVARAGLLFNEQPIYYLVEAPGGWSRYWRILIVIGLVVAVYAFFVAKPRDTVVPKDPSSFGPLYLATLGIELLSGGFRATVVMVFLTVVLAPCMLFFGAYRAIDQESLEALLRPLAAGFLITFVVGVLLGLYPIVRSILTAVMNNQAVDGATIAAMGAREPTREELENIIDALKHIQGRNKSVTAPAAWLVIDSPIPNSFTIGNAVFLTRELVNSDYLVGAMVHELGHIANGDGQLLLATRRLVMPVAYFLGIDQRPDPVGLISGGSVGQQQVKQQSLDQSLYYKVRSMRLLLFLSVFFGGFGLSILSRQWAGFWRTRDFAADNYLAKRGFSEELIEFLEKFQPFDLAHPYYLSGRPYTAERIDRLRG